MAIQLQEFAKQVLFGKTLEEKLSFPREEIIDTDPGDPVKTPRHLARPEHLRLREDGVRASHPSVAKLVDEKERGRLLHFFGNHELLATELMALALLKFPDAPKSFRRGLLDTLKDEQIHTRIYIHRMQQCGVTFGELPLSDYFWKSVSPMEDPLDYVTRLSLTFEQANLDYSREYGKIFQSLGDAPTASILDKIYRDEIEHVGFGLRWFRKWKDAGKTDWEAYRERLSFPLSPSRAKGNTFNPRGRSEAGLDDDFIKGLQVFNQSRGRTPNVYWFNPDAESYAARNSSDGLGESGSTLQSDLSFLCAYLSRKDDILLAPSHPRIDFLETLSSFGFALPEILASNGLPSGTAPKIDRKIGELRPWAWTPDSLAFFRSTFDSLTRKSPVDTLWTPQRRTLFSKSKSASWAKESFTEPASDWLAPASVFGEVVTDLASLISAREKFALLGYGDIVCKLPFATAAFGQRCLMEGEAISPTIEKWLNDAWASQKELVVEPWLKRVFDFSVQFERRNGETRILAFTRLQNNARGQFKGIIVNAFAKGLAPDLVKFLLRRETNQPRLYHWFESCLLPKLDTLLATSGFQGPIGIDALVYRDPNGDLRLKPIVEINPRYTMGRIAHEVGKHLSHKSVGIFQILTHSQLKKHQFKTFEQYVTDLAKKHPVSIDTKSKPLIEAGSFPLTDPKQARQFLALFHARKSFEQLPL